MYRQTIITNQAFTDYKSAFYIPVNLITQPIFVVYKRNSLVQYRDRVVRLSCRLTRPSPGWQQLSCKSIG